VKVASLGEFLASLYKSITTTTVSYGHYTGQPALAGTPVKSWSFAGAKFYCPHALADGN